ncbi:MAG TPA: oligosaccharide flippase family protein [Pyrinomonadaceae bacterium]
MQKIAENKTAQTSKSIIRNIFYGFLTWIFPLCLSFVATPIIVRALGNDDYGIYALVIGFIGYSFTFSIGRAITKYVAEYRANGEPEKIRDIVSATFFINITVGVCGVLLICLLANWLVRDVFKIEASAQDKTVMAMYLASAIIFVTMLTQVFSAVLQGLQRFDVYSKIFNASSFSLLLGNLIFAYQGYGLLTLLVWNLLVICSFCSVYAIIAKKLLPEFGISFRIKRESLKLVLHYSFGIIGYQIMANLLLLFERGWITRHLGTESLTYYVVPMSLGMYVHGFISSLMLVIFPLASELKNDKEKLLRLYTKATKIVGLLVVFMATTLIVENKFFLQLWMGRDFAQNSSKLLVLHAITFGLAAILTVSWQMTEGLGFPNYNFAVFAICLVVSVVLMIVLTENFGNTGIAAARLAGFATIFFSIFYVEKWFFNKIQISFWLRITSILAVAAAFVAVVETLVINNLPVSWLTFVISAAGGGLVYCTALWLLDFIDADEKILIRGILNR